MEGMFLQSIEALDDSSVGAGEIWGRLQTEKEEVEREILAEEPLTAEAEPPQEREPSEESAHQVGWYYRQTLEDRLRSINDAQDRLIDGGYGICASCGRSIDLKRLLANPAVSMCIVCQKDSEAELLSCSL